MDDLPRSTERNSLIRLNRYLAQCGLGARRKCDELIAAGHIFVNGEKVTGLGTKVDPEKDAIEYRGKRVKPVRKLEYLAYFKPRGVMVTRNDPEKRETVYDALRKAGIDADHLNYVGRLDYASEGLLLLTNDGDLVHALTHPRFHIKKVYRVRLGKPLRDEDRNRLIQGVVSEGQVLHAGNVRVYSQAESRDRAVRGADRETGEQYWYEVDLYEGKNRQIRRMFEELGYDIRRLRRVQFGSVKIGELNAGECRKLTEREIAGLKASGYKNSGER